MIQDVTAGRVIPRKVDELSTAVDRAKRDQAVHRVTKIPTFVVDKDGLIDVYLTEDKGPVRIDTPSGIGALTIAAEIAAELFREAIEKAKRPQ